MNPYNLALLLFAFCSFFVGLLVLLKRNDEVGRTFCIFSVFVTGWGIGTALMLNNDSTLERTLFAARTAHFCAIFLTAAWLHFIFAYLGMVQKRTVIIKLIYLSSIIFSLFTYSPEFIPTMKPIVGFHFYTHGGPIYYIYTVWYFSIITYGFVELIRYWRNQSGEKKSQSGWFIWTMIIGFVNGSLSFLPVFDISFPQYNFFLTPFYPFLMAYVIMKQKFFDVDEVLAIHRDKLALIGLMSSSINHEIKNPLFMLQEMSRKALANVDGGDPQLKGTLQKMSDQIGRMSKLVTRLGEFGKPGASSELEKVDIKQTLDDALFFASQELKYHNIEVKLNFDSNLPRLSGNRSQFEEIFLNLIVNAYHAMPDGGALTIEACVIASPVGAKQSMKITISDTGHGIPKDQLKDIFKPFYTTKQKTGTGLGLYIVKTLVEQNKGKIEVVSELGKGTTFNLLFNGVMHE